MRGRRLLFVATAVLLAVACGDDEDSSPVASEPAPETTASDPVPEPTVAAEGDGIRGTARNVSDVVDEPGSAWSGLVVLVPDGVLAGDDLTYGAGAHPRAELEDAGAHIAPAQAGGSFALDEASEGDWQLCLAYDADPVQLLGCVAVTAPAEVDVTYGEGGLEVART